MSIEIKIPKEITEYREKIIFGLSGRQLISITIGLGLSIGVYLLLYEKIGHELTGWIVIILSIPIFSLGFMRINNFTFDKYVKNVIRHYLGDREVSYKIPKMNKPIKKKKKIKTSRKNEYSNKRKIKVKEKIKRKKIKKAIKKAKKEHKRQKKKLSKNERGILKKCFSKIKVKLKIKKIMKQEREKDYQKKKEKN